MLSHLIAPSASGNGEDVRYTGGREPELFAFQDIPLEICITLDHHHSLLAETQMVITGYFPSLG